MSSGPISLSALLVGTTAVAALYALHHLRPRPQVRPVATLLFWNSAARPQRPRRLWARPLRHLRTFLLLVTIALLLAMTWTAGHWSRRPAVGRIAVVDTGRSMGTPDAAGRTRLDAAVRLAAADAARFARPPALVIAGEQPTLPGDPADPDPAFEQHLHRLIPGATAADSTAALNLADTLSDGKAVIDWYTDRPTLPPDLRPELAARVVLRRPAFSGDTVAITEVTFAFTSPTDGTLRVRLAGRAGPPVRVELAHDGSALTTRRLSVVDGVADVRFEHVAADGGDVIVRVGESGERSAVRHRLPRTSAVRFDVADDMPPVLRAAVSVLNTPASAATTIHVDGEHAPLPTTSPCIRVLAATETAKAGISVEPGQPSVEGLDFEAAVATGTISVPVGATPLLRAGEGVVAALDPARRVLYLSDAVLGVDADLPRRAAFPIFLRRACAVLSNDADAPPTVTADRAVRDPLWSAVAADGVGVVDPALESAPPAPPTSDRDAGTFWTGPSWTTVLLAIGLTLLFLEAALAAVRRIT